MYILGMAKTKLPRQEEHVGTYIARVRPDPEDPSYWLTSLVDERRVHTFGKSMPEALKHLEEATKLWFLMDEEEPIKLIRVTEGQESR